MSKKLSVNKINRIKRDIDEHFILDDRVQHLTTCCTNLASILSSSNNYELDKTKVLAEIADVLITLEYFVDNKIFGSDEDLINEFDIKYLKLEKFISIKL